VWDDTEPFIFTMAEDVGPVDGRRKQSEKFDLTDLKMGFTDEFILNLKEFVIERRNQVTLETISSQENRLHAFFKDVIASKLFDIKVGVIDEAFLLRLSSVQQSLPEKSLRYLKAAFKSDPYSPLFDKLLHASNFPTVRTKKGHHGSQIARILEQTLSRAAIAHILDACDSAYGKGELDIGHYSFTHLAFAVFVRPTSYMQIRVGDLELNTKSKQYSIRIVTAKTGEAVPSKVNYRVNEPLGVLLTKQRQHVIETYGHLVPSEDIQKLALFPARQLMDDGKRWSHKYANDNFGMYSDSTAFNLGYGKAIKKNLKDRSLTLGANALRHTVGTLLAQTGASAKTIQAVLRHATDVVCKAYVDIAVAGISSEISKAMHPAFQVHLPSLVNFGSKSDLVTPEKLIQSEDCETGQIVDTGECGKSIACANAPIVCYGCFRFRPFWDADHSVNLRVAEREMEDMSRRGTPFLQMMDRARTAKNKIIVIMNAADRYRDAMDQGAQS
jgi:integrase